MAIRTSFKPRALIHELVAPLFRLVLERCDIINSHLKRVLRAVSRLECEIVPLRFFSTLGSCCKNSSFGAQRWTVGLIKLNGSPCERWLSLRMRYCHSGTLQFFRSVLEEIWRKHMSRARVRASHRATQRSGKFVDIVCLFGRLSLNSLSVCAITVREQPNLHVSPTSEMSQT